MIRGQVNARLEARIRLTVIGPMGATADFDAVIDTGFSGSLVLPKPAVASLGLARRSGGTAVLADGSTCNFDTYSAEMDWNGARRGIVVSAVGHEVLAGMVLLAGQKLAIEIEDDGAVEVTPLQPNVTLP